MEPTSSNKERNQGSGDFKRLTAYKISIKDLLEYQYIKEEGWNPNYLIGPKGNISRINIIGFITSKENNSIILDDSTSSVNIRSFENLGIFKDKEIGDLVLVVGKPREFGNERYIVPDIIRKLDEPLWLKVRHKELNIETPNIHSFIHSQSANKEEMIEKENKPLEPENITSSQPKKEKSSYETIIDLINENDSGEGVGIDELIAKSGLDNCEKIINTLLEEGEIFEIRPGIVKVL